MARLKRTHGRQSTFGKCLARPRLNVLDENFPDDQRSLLREWRVPFRSIGRDIADLGIKDPDIIPLLHRRRFSTFFTQDQDFFSARLCHAAYCLVWLDATADDTAHFVRNFLRHPRFATRSSRMGVVARVHHHGIHFWQRNQGEIQQVAWRDK